MARILICHVPKDGGIARDLGSALMARGHFVSFDGEPDALRADRATRLRQFEGIVVLWTEASHQSAGLAQIARETLPLNLLIPVRSDDLALGRLPLMFRKLNMISPRDIEGLARVIARMSAAATSLKEIAQQVAKLDNGAGRPLQPIVPRESPQEFVEYPVPPRPAPPAPPTPVAPPPFVPYPEAFTETLPAPLRAPPTEAIIPAQQPRYAPPPPAPSRAPPTEAIIPAQQPRYAPPPPAPSRAPLTEAIIPAQQPRYAPPPPAPSRAPLTEAIIPAQHARYTALKPLHVDLPDVSEPAQNPLAAAKNSVAIPQSEDPQIPPQLAPKPWRPGPAKKENQRHAAGRRPAPQPREQTSPYSAIANAEVLAQAIEAGLLLHYIPETMWLGEAAAVEVRLDREVMRTRFKGPGALVVETLSLSLYGTGEAFEIDRQSERTQFVGKGSSSEGAERSNIWSWLVRPQAPGAQELVVRVSAVVLDRHGVPAPVALPDRRFSVRVAARGVEHVMSSLSGWTRR